MIFLVLGHAHFAMMNVTVELEKMDAEYVRLAHAEGVLRTQQILRKEGKL